MTADVELLPLPEWTKRDDAGQNMVPSEIRVSMADYARANVAHATAAKDAEIEALRAEAVRTEAELHQQAELAEARAERLAEALREDAVCAERYRWLRCGGWEVMQDPKYWRPELRFDAAIDQARGKGVAE